MPPMQTAALGHQEGRAQDGAAEGGQEAVKALYARVSTKDKGQDVENQLAQMAFSDGLAGAAPYVSARTCPPPQTGT